MIEITSHEPAPSAVEARVKESALSSRTLVLHLAAVLAVSSLAAGLLAGRAAAVSTVLGVGLSALNLLAMRRILRVLQSASGLGALWALAFPVKLVALVVTAFALVNRDVADPVPLAIGFALLPLSSVFLPRPSEAASTAGAPLVFHASANESDRRA